MSAAKARKAVAVPTDTPTPQQVIEAQQREHQRLTYDQIEDRIEEARETIFSAKVVLDLVEAGTALHNEQPVSLWNVHEAMRMAGRMLTDAATRLEWHALSAAKPEEACHE